MEKKDIIKSIDVYFENSKKKENEKDIFFENKNITDACSTWHNIREKKYFRSATLYNPDSPFDFIELNGNCDLKEFPISSILPNDMKEDNIECEINNLQNLIDIIDKYPIITNVKYNIDILLLHKIKPSLEKLNKMIGMRSLKERIVDQILYFIQDLHLVNDNNNDFLHTVIYGPPGTGKTEIAMIIGEIFCNLGILKKGVFKKVIRSDLVAGYLGQTAIKTKETIESCIGGVMFIDEAYSLGNEEKKDSFSKECIDILCESLSANKDNLMVIIAGYEDELEKCFFSMNQGLDSRFCWRFNTDKYNSEELAKIFILKVEESKWSLSKNINIYEWFDNNSDNFTAFGRDIESFFSKVKISHGRRIFTKPKNERTIINNKDIENGFTLFLENKTRKKNESKQFLDSMYT
jgi:AAA+ superfamily predicted ATPase